ncbi:MAG: hypothetical protein NT024_14355 [Proteobacteria bacterium]|nr:hypothetical protein [Pseudomonadota bacterium]
MNYEQTVEYLYGIRLFGIKLGLALVSLLSFERFAAFEVPTAHALIMARVSSCAQHRRK